MTGRLIAVVGPSGAGKDTLIRAALAANPALVWARRCITRPPAESEPFESLSEDAFADRLARGDFALHWRAHGLGYGVPHSELAPLAMGHTVIFNGSRAALAQSVTQYPDLGIIEITAPPALRALRLARRAREEAGDIAARLGRSAPKPPMGVPVQRVDNDGTIAQGVARFQSALAALQPDRGAR